MTEPKVGDRVRCTLGENVIVGEIQGSGSTASMRYLSVIYGSSSWYHVAHLEPTVWTIEVIERERERGTITPNPDDEQQVKALAEALADAERSNGPGYRDLARAVLTFLRDGGRP